MRVHNSPNTVLKLQLCQIDVDLIPRFANFKTGNSVVKSLVKCIIPANKL